MNGAVYVVDLSQLENARTVVERFVKGAMPSDAALAAAWHCPGCGETVEGQFDACWKCGTTKPA